MIAHIHLYLRINEVRVPKANLLHDILVVGVPNPLRRISLQRMMRWRWYPMMHVPVLTMPSTHYIVSILVG